MNLFGRRIVATRDALEQLSIQRRALDPTDQRDPKTMTSWEIHARVQELRATAVRLSLEKRLGRDATPAEIGQEVERDRSAREARLDTLAAELAFPAGTPQSEIDAYVRRKADARARRLAELGIQSDHQEDDEQ